MIVVSRVERGMIEVRYHCSKWRESSSRCVVVLRNSLSSINLKSQFLVLVLMHRIDKGGRYMITSVLKSSNNIYIPDASVNPGPIIL